MSPSNPDDEHGRAVKRGAFPARRREVEQAEPFVPDPASADETTPDATSPGTDDRRAPHPADDVAGS